MSDVPECEIDFDFSEDTGAQGMVDTSALDMVVLDLCNQTNLLKAALDAITDADNHLLPNIEHLS